MIANKINPILKCVLCLVLCVSMCFSMCFLRPVEVKAAPIALAALSAATLTISLFSWFGWAIDVGEELSTTTEFKELYSRLGSGCENFWHFIIGDLAEWHYEKYGYLHSISEDFGYYIDDNGNVMHPSYIAENPTDIADIDWDQFEKEGTLSFSIDANVYNDIWFEIQEFMHGGSGVKCFSEFVQEVSVEPTISELRDSAYNLYLGNLAYWTEDYHDGKYASGGIPESDASYYTFNNDNLTACFEERSFVYSYAGQAYSLYIDFSNDLCPWCLGDNGTTNEFFCNWAVSSPYLVNFDGNTYYKFYLFNFDETNPVIVPSVRISGTYSHYEYYCNQPFTYAGSIIEKYDVLLNPSSSSSSVDDTVRNSATANQYAGTVEDDDGNPIPVTAPGKAGTTTVTGGSSVTNPVTGVKGEDYANGTSVPMTGTVTGSATVTQTDTGVKSEVNSVVSTATVDYPDGFESWEPSIKLLTKFPFCIPYDLYSCFAILYKDPKELYFEIPFKFEQYGIDEIFVIDLRNFDNIVLIVRYMVLIGFVIFLTLKTRDLIKG